VAKINVSPIYDLGMSKHSKRKRYDSSVAALDGWLKKYPVDRGALKLVQSLGVGIEHSFDNPEDFNKFSKVVFVLNKAKPFSFHILAARYDADPDNKTTIKYSATRMKKVQNLGAMKAFSIWRLK
jgi:hypothetical protein